MEGQVKWFSNSKGYGFIETNEKDVFVHHSAIKAEGYRTLNKGDKVTFEVVEGDKGPQAKDVVVTEAAPVSEREEKGRGPRREKR